MLTIRRPVTVKTIVTEQLQQELAADLQEAIQKLDTEISQIDYHGKRMLADMEKNHPEKLAAFQQQVEGERLKRIEAKAKIVERVKEVAKLQLDQEIIHSTVDSDITINVGDKWDKVTTTEIILKDGVIVDIRNAE